MTVGKLKQELEKYDDDLEVCFSHFIKEYSMGMDRPKMQERRIWHFQDVQERFLDATDEVEGYRKAVLLG